jgi:hypothetical protein
MDALAPVAGAAATLLFPVEQEVLGLALALFAGFFFTLVRAICSPRAIMIIQPAGRRR